MKRAKKPKLKVSDKEKSDVLKYLGAKEKEMRIESIRHTQVIMLAAFSQYLKDRGTPLTEGELDKLAKDVVRYCKYVEDDMITLKEIQEIFNNQTGIELNIC